MEDYIITLKNLSFPNASHLSKDSFQGKNRLFLLHWILKQFSVNIPLPDDFHNSTSFISSLANMFESFGFCSVNQKMNFIKGTINEAEEAKIFYRIFDALKATHTNAQNSSPKSDDGANLNISMEYLISNPTEGLKEFFKSSRNLFSNRGPIIKYTDSERNEKSNLLNEDIACLEEELKSIEKQPSSNFTENFDYSKMSLDELAIIPKNLQKSTENFISSSSFLLHNNCLKNRKEVVTEDDLKNNTESINRTMKEIAQFSDSSKICKESFKLLEKEQFQLLDKARSAEKANELNEAMEILLTFK